MNELQRLLASAPGPFKDQSTQVSTKPGSSMDEPEPLGVFGAFNFDPADEALVHYLVSISGAVPEGEPRRKLARYLRSAPMVAAWMGYSKDIIGKSFEVAGGDATVTDGDFYWRFDTADYVETYGVALPDAFVKRALEADRPSSLLESSLLEIDRSLKGSLYPKAKDLLRRLVDGAEGSDGEVSRDSA